MNRAAAAAATHRTHVFTVLPLQRSRGPYERFVTFATVGSSFTFNVHAMYIVRSCSMFQIPIMPSREQLFTHMYSVRSWVSMFSKVRVLCDDLWRCDVWPRYEASSTGRLNGTESSGEWWHTTFEHILQCAEIVCLFDARAYLLEPDAFCYERLCGMCAFLWLLVAPSHSAFYIAAST